MVTDMQIPVLMSSDKLTQPIIAPVQDTLVAKQNYAVGDEFIYNNGLYKATAVINATAPITIGTNAVAAPTVMEQVNKKYIVDDIAATSTTADLSSLDIDRYEFLCFYVGNPTNTYNLVTIPVSLIKAGITYHRSYFISNEGVTVAIAVFNYSSTLKAIGMQVGANNYNCYLKGLRKN